MFNPFCLSDFVFFTQLLTFFFSLSSVSSCVWDGYKLGTFYSGKGNPYTKVVIHNWNMG